MQKSSQRKTGANVSKQPIEFNGQKADVTSLETHMDELRNELSGSFRNSVYAQGLAAVNKDTAPTEEMEMPWNQLMLTEIHMQLLKGFVRCAEAFGVDSSLINYDSEVHQNKEGDVKGFLIMQPEKDATLPAQNQTAREKLLEFVQEVQSWVEENDDTENGVFEVHPVKTPYYVIIEYDYDVLYNALNSMVPELHGLYTASPTKIDLIEESLNSALHVMERYDTPAFRLN
jgi:hypothetical protein